MPRRLPTARRSTQPDGPDGWKRHFESGGHWYSDVGSWCGVHAWCGSCRLVHTWGRMVSGSCAPSGRRRSTGHDWDVRRMSECCHWVTVLQLCRVRSFSITNCRCISSTCSPAVRVLCRINLPEEADLPWSHCQTVWQMFHYRPLEQIICHTVNWQMFTFCVSIFVCEQ